MANLQNLKVPTSEQAREYGRKGGKARAENAKKNKTFKTIINKFLDAELTQEELKQQMIEFGFADEEISNKAAAVFSMWKEVIKGNTKAFEILREIIGEKDLETSTININNNIQNPYNGLTVEELKKLAKECDMNGKT